MQDLWRVLVAILHLGNCAIARASRREDEACVPDDDRHSAKAALLLGVRVGELRKWICHRRITAGREVYVKRLTVDQALGTRDAIAKHTYERLFHYIVSRMDSALSCTHGTGCFIGVLDIYGFETFPYNSFEQFCINYANEKLQQQFNQYVFKLEQAEYEREGIQWSFIDFYDNQPCIDLIEGKAGILALLDEECRMPKGTDQTFVQKLFQFLGGSTHLVQQRLAPDTFVVRHYAENVIYDGAGFLVKNNDALWEEIVQLLAESSQPFVAGLFDRYESVGTSHTGRANGPLRPANEAVQQRAGARIGSAHDRPRQTLGVQFKDSLVALMRTLDATRPHYVRCIKPNSAKMPLTFAAPLCVQQLRACGIIETIRISAAGYPSRWLYLEFLERYGILLPCERRFDTATDVRRKCAAVLQRHFPEQDRFQCGATKIFLRAGAVAYLEARRSETLCATAIAVQACFRGFVCRRDYRRICTAVRLVQRYARGLLARRDAERMRRDRAATRIAAAWRGFVARRYYARIRRAAAVLQCLLRGWRARRRVRAMREDRAAARIQHWYRGRRVRRTYEHDRRWIIVAQSCVRRWLARRQLRRLREEARNVQHLQKLNWGLENRMIALQRSLDASTASHAQLLAQMDTLKGRAVELNGALEDAVAAHERERSTWMTQVEAIGRSADAALAAVKRAYRSADRARSWWMADFSERLYALLADCSSVQGEASAQEAACVDRMARIGHDVDALRARFGARPEPSVPDGPTAAPADIVASHQALLSVRQQLESERTQWVQPLWQRLELLQRDLQRMAHEQASHRAYGTPAQRTLMQDLVGAHDAALRTVRLSIEADALFSAQRRATPPAARASHESPRTPLDGSALGDDGDEAGEPVRALTIVGAAAALRARQRALQRRLDGAQHMLRQLDELALQIVTTHAPPSQLPAVEQQQPTSTTTRTAEAPEIAHPPASEPMEIVALEAKDIPAIVAELTHRPHLAASYAEGSTAPCATAMLLFMCVQAADANGELSVATTLLRETAAAVRQCISVRRARHCVRCAARGCGDRPIVPCAAQRCQGDRNLLLLWLANGACLANLIKQLPDVPSHQDKLRSRQQILVGLVSFVFVEYVRLIREHLEPLVVPSMLEYQPSLHNGASRVSREATAPLVYVRAPWHDGVIGEAWLTCAEQA